MFGLSSRLSKLKFDSQQPECLDSRKDQITSALESMGYREPTAMTPTTASSSPSPSSSPIPSAYMHHHSPNHHLHRLPHAPALKNVPYRTISSACKYQQAMPANTLRSPNPNSASRYCELYPNRDFSNEKRSVSLSTSPHQQCQRLNPSPVDSLSGRNSPSFIHDNSFHELGDLFPPTKSIRKVHIIKDSKDRPDAGITLCGGVEVGLQGTIYVSRVVEDSIAEKVGLCPGDQILSVNYTSFLDPSITCQKALHLICSQEYLELNILPRSEAIIYHRRHHTYSWVDPEGHSVSPPPVDRDISEESGMDLLEDSASSGLLPPSPRRRISLAGRYQDQPVRVVKILMEKGLSSGLMIRGGLEYGLGIYVTGVESMSAAERGGLKVGDQILSVNNHDFRNVLHDEAVDILKSSPRLTMKVRYVGKVPVSSASLIEDMGHSSGENSQLNSSEGSSSSKSQNDYSGNLNPSSRCSLNQNRRSSRSPCSSSRLTGSEIASPTSLSRRDQGKHVTPTLMVTETSEDILEKNLNILLPGKDRITFAYYRNEYETKGMTVDAFIALVLELLDTFEKYTLVNHIRNIIREEDLDKFDELIFKREEQAMIKSKANPQESRHFITSDEESSEYSISFGQERATSDYNSVEDGARDDGRSIPSQMDRNLSENGSGSRLGPPEISSLSPLPFDKEVPRRHSSCTPEVRMMSATSNDYLAVNNSDERRWSIADERDIPNSYMGYNYNYRDLAPRSHSGGEMANVSKNNRSHTSPSGNRLQIPMSSSNMYSQNQAMNRYPPVMQSRVRRHSSLPGPNPSKNPFSSSPFHHQPHRSSSFRMPNHRAVREPDGRLRVFVKKSNQILGIAIEGGADVPTQNQPRVISIHSSGAAFNTGDLHVGHIILEVDNRSTANMTHEEVARMIADAYYNTPYKDHIELLVREKSKNEFDLRRSSFMLLNNSFE